MDKLRRIIDRIEPLDEPAMAQARARQDMLTKPPGSLGRLEEVAIQIAGIQRQALPRVRDKAIITMAGDHGVVTEKIGNWPQEVTAQMVANFLRGGAAINVLARQVGARMVAVNMGVAGDLKADPGLVWREIGRGTRNMTLGPAMTEQQAQRSIATGIEIAETELHRGLDIVGTGDMGIGNTTASSAICAAVIGAPVAEVTGRGTGLTDDQLARKIEVIEKALEVNNPDPGHPLEVLAKVGGFEIGGLAGLMLAAAAHRVPVVLDGFISGAAALIATGLAPALKDFLIPAHLSTEPGHPALLRHLGLKPLLELDLRLGEGTGAALGIFLTEAAIRLLAEMATFDEAGVSEGDGQRQ